MAKIKVATIKEITREGKKPFWVIHDDKGSKFQLWDRKYWDVLQPGNVVDIDVQFSGDFVNIKEAKLIEGQPRQDNAPAAPREAPAQQPPPPVLLAEPTLRAQAVLAASYGGLSGDKAVIMAEHYFQYFIKGSAYAEGCKDRLRRQAPPDPETMITMDQVFDQARFRWGTDERRVCRELGYSERGEIIETPPDAWKQLCYIFAETKQASF